MSDGPLQQPRASTGTQLTKPKRRRRAHFKSHGGCTTCKIRKKKCDETKPACLRCTSTGRRCDGYVMNNKVTNSADSSKSRGIHQSGLGSMILMAPTNSVDWRVDDLKNSSTQIALKYNLCLNDVASSSSTSSWLGENNSHEELSPATYSDTSSVSSALGNDPYSHRYPRSPGSRIKPLPIINLQLNDIERHCFDFFKLKTGPALAAYLGSSIWQGLAIKIGSVHPAVMSCIIAVGAVHRRHQYGISREAFEYCAHASKLHGKACKELARLRGRIDDHTATADDIDMLMTCEALLSIFHNFQGEEVEAVKYVHFSIRRLLDRPLKLLHREEHNFDLSPRPNRLLSVLEKLKYYGDNLFDRPVAITSYSETVKLPPIPDVFNSIEEARDFIFTEAYWISTAVFRAQNKSELQRFHVKRITQWSVSHAETVKVMKRTPGHNRRCRLMKMMRCVAYSILYIGISTAHVLLADDPRLGSKSWVYEELWRIMEQREEVVADIVCFEMVAETYLNQQSPFHYTEHDISFDSAIGPPRNNQLKPESSAKIRHMVRYINNVSIDVPPNLGIYGIAERAGGLEEHAVISAIKDSIPDAIDLVWTDITCSIEDRRILLRYCKPDSQRPGLLWTQEWYSF